MSHLAWRTRACRGCATPNRGSGSSPVEGLHVEVDGAAAGEPDGERLVVGEAEGDDTPLALARQHLERGDDHRTLHASAGDRARDLAVVAHGHGGAGITG